MPKLLLFRKRHEACLETFLRIAADERFKHAICLLLLTCVSLFIIIAYFQIDAFTILGSCLLYLLIIIFILISRFRRKNSEKRLADLQLILLISSSAFAAATAIRSNQLIAIQPTIMYIIYTQLAVENSQALLATLAANLIHLIVFPFRNRYHQHDNHHQTEPQSSATIEHISPYTTLFIQLAEIILVYIVFHLAGYYLNKQSHDNCKRSFRDVKSYVSAKIEMDTEDKKLTKLLESVIPKHLAGKMRDDILLPRTTGNFEQVYLESFDNVSILFADIVNFTKISSNCSAQALVETLNELFGRFDEAADMNRCLRIKILGDCYYCVSGIPDLNEDHAERSVDMGLDMIDILSDLAQDNSEVDLNMRVGIHSGRVLCGVMGKKKWQFDVHSNDVRVANHTEQSGVPGRVHITGDTLRALGGRYEVEPGNGHLRDTYIAQKSISTYFVIAPPDRPRTSTRIGVPVGLVPRVNSSLAISSIAGKQRFKLATQRLINALHFIRTIDAPFANLDSPKANGERMMYETIASRSQIKDIDRLTLKFKDDHVGRLYGSVSLVQLLKRSLIYISAFVCLSWLAYRTLFDTSFHHHHHHHHHHNQPHDHDNSRKLDDNYNNSSNGGANSNKFNYNPPNEETTNRIGGGANLLTNINRASGGVGGDASGIGLNDGELFEEYTMTEMTGLMGVFLFIFTLTTLVYAHQAELNSRRDFIWRQIAIADKDTMARMRDCNKFIFFNLLPPHVASYFLKRDAVRSHMDLYHKSYERIGVIFATVSDFGDFYTEEQGNNHGLECLRFLNEIICDFDSLLDDERFKAVDKIKTIGSTYMAAIGLFPEYELPTTEDADRGEIARYLHILVLFVIEMKERLQEINENCFNNFELRVGVNLGPVNAGVIGATKPQYDIWGNTVNVASRMESTAEPGRIQITDEVYQILKDFNDEHQFVFTCRGSINVKGKGIMTTYYLGYPQKKKKDTT